MGHKRHYSHESDHHKKSGDPKASTYRSKSYPRDESNRKRSSERHEHRQNKHESKKAEYLIENHSKKHHKDKKKHEKSEKEKFNIEKCLKEKYKKSHIGHHQQNIYLNDREKCSYKIREIPPKKASLLDLMNFEYYIAPMQIKPEKTKFRSKSGGDKRSKESEHFDRPNEGYSKSQDDCKHKEEDKKQSKYNRKVIQQEPSASLRKSHQEKYINNSDRKHKNKHKYSSKPRSSRISPNRRLYDYFRLEKSVDSQEVDRVKHNVSSRNDSDEVLPTRNDSINHKKKHSKNKRKSKEESKKKSEEDIKQYFLKIQNLIDEKLNTFLHRNASMPSTCPKVLSNIQINDHRWEKGNKNHKKSKEIPVSPEPNEIPILTVDDQKEKFIKENMVNTHHAQEDCVKSNNSDDTQQKSTKELKIDENSRHPSLPKNNISDSASKKLKISNLGEMPKILPPRKTIKTLECKTVSIVSIAPHEKTERIGKITVKSPDMFEDTIEKKKKSKRFKKYYNYCTEKRIDSNGISSTEKSIVSDSFKDVQDTNETKELTTTHGNQIKNKEKVPIFNLYETKVNSLPPYWLDKKKQFWPQHGISKFNFTNCKNNKCFNEPANFVTKIRSREDDGFIKVYSNKGLKCKESSSDSLVSKSSIRSTDQTKVNVKLILGPRQLTTFAKNSNYSSDNYEDKAIEYLENEKTDERISRIEKLLNETIHLEEFSKKATFTKQQPAEFSLPKTFISKLLEDESKKKTYDIGVGTTNENIDYLEKNKNLLSNEKNWSHFSVQADLINNEKTWGNSISMKKSMKDVGVNAEILHVKQSISKTEAKKQNTFKDQYAQFSPNQPELVRVNKKSIKFQSSTRSLGISTSLPFLREQRRTNLRTRRSGSVRGTADTLESTVASLICLHRFHGERISSSNKSNSHSLNDYFIKPLICNSPRRSSLFLTKQYRTTEQSSYQKRKIYDEKIRRRMKRKCIHNKEFSPPVFEVRFVTVENKSSQSNPLSSPKEVTRDYVRPTFEKLMQKTKRKQIVKKRYSRNLFSYAIRDVDMLWKSKKKRATSQEEEKGKATSFVEQNYETVGTKTNMRPRKSVPDLKGVIDFICKSLVTYYHNTNYRDRSNERSDGILNKKNVEALYYSDHYQKESSSSNSFSDTEYKSSVSDSKYTKSTILTTSSSQKCMCFNNSCPTLNSADSFFDYPYRTERTVNPTILGYALNNKSTPTESYKKKDNSNDVSLSEEESGYSSERIKSDLSSTFFFNKPNIAALLQPNNNDRKTFTHFCSHQKEFTEHCLKVKNEEKYSESTLKTVNKWNNNFDCDYALLYRNQKETSFGNVLEDNKSDYIEPMKNNDRQEYLNNTNNSICPGKTYSSHNVPSGDIKESVIKQSYGNYQKLTLNNAERNKNNNENHINLEDVKKQEENSKQKIHLARIDNEKNLHNKSMFQEEFIEKKSISVGNISKGFNSDINAPDIIDKEISKEKNKQSFNCLCCKTSSTEDHLFTLIERDLREIYKPSASKKKFNNYFKYNCKRFFGLLFGNEKKYAKNVIGRTHSQEISSGYL